VKKYSKGTLRMNKQEGLEMTGEFSPFIRFCIGVGILLLCATPFVLAIRWW